jgi:carboxyl-terminal processing protease
VLRNCAATLFATLEFGARLCYNSPSQMSIRKASIYFLLLGVLALTFGAGYIAYPLMHGATLPASSVLFHPFSGQNMDVFWEAWKLLDRDFYGAKPDSAARTYGAVRGMVQSFGDPYTYFVEPAARALERDELRGSFGGIGANIEASDAGYLLHPFPDQPAAEAGVQDGDLLLMVEDVEITTQMAIDEVVGLIRGPVDTPVNLLVRRTGGDELSSEELTIQVMRAEIVTPSIQWRMLADISPGEQVGYIEHSLFTERSPAEMQQAIEELSGQGADSFVLDLRGNPGGLVSAAVDIADMWLGAGDILIERRANGSEKVFTADAEMIRDDAPLVILVDQNSASASEILAGALRDNGRATLVGETTFGKGSVQLIHELSDESSLHVTNAEWLTPNRNQISDHGLTPDVALAEDADPLAEAIALATGQTVAKASPPTPESPLAVPSTPRN